MQLITKDLYDQILLEPLKRGVDQLSIVSGYATPTMAAKHIEDITRLAKGFKVSVLVGMCPIDGIGKSTHAGFQSLTAERKLGLDFSCSYVYKMPAVHSKVYIFSQGGSPKYAFVGSANYTQAAFAENRSEALTNCDPAQAKRYFDFVENNSIICNHGEIEEHIRLVSQPRYNRIINREEVPQETTTEGILLDAGAARVEFDLKPGEKSGLNWGQRDGREPNQAYISIPSQVYNTSFFPPRKTYFTVITDDGKSLICVRAQDNGKAIHTPTNNSLLGEYFRNRLGLPNGQFVTMADLQRYGRTKISFTKIDDETYYMDFSL